jgi:hypothetical protein
VNSSPVGNLIRSNFFFFSNIYFIFQTTVLPARMTHHPPPASQAPARGVDHGWNNGKWQKRANDTPPAPSPTSNCSWGGSWVERCQCQHRPMTTTTYHPPPAPRATAHGVDRGWNDDRKQGGGARGKTTQHPPPTTASICLQGGSCANGHITAYDNHSNGGGQIVPISLPCTVRGRGFILCFSSVFILCS